MPEDDIPGAPKLIEREVMEDGSFIETYELPTGDITRARGWYTEDGERVMTLSEVLGIGNTVEEEVAYLDEKFKES